MMVLGGGRFRMSEVPLSRCFCFSPEVFSPERTLEMFYLAINPEHCTLYPNFRSLNATPQNPKPALSLSHSLTLSLSLSLTHTHTHTHPLSHSPKPEIRSSHHPVAASRNPHIVCSGSEEGSYSRLVDFLYHSTPGRE